MADALEQDGLVLGALHVCEGAHGLGAFVRVGREHVVQAHVAQLLQEPLDVGSCGS